MLALLGGALACACTGNAPPAVSAASPSPADPASAQSQNRAADPEARSDAKIVGELLRGAEAQRRAGNREAEYAYLAQVIERDSAHPRAHARLAELTGPAPSRGVSGIRDPVLRALEHPYDPKALLAAGEALADAGRTDPAIEYLERAVWLADLDPRAALTAIQRLRGVSEPWRRRRIVPVELHADEWNRSQPGWQFQLRSLWLSASAMLDSLLETRFVPIAILSFDAGELPNDLDAIHAAFLAQTRPPSDGIFALISGRPLPGGDAVHRKGVAEFLGRGLAARVPEQAVESRVLAHEILHLYGAIHVLDDVDSLMNPTGVSLALDAPNVRIVRALRGRAFGFGGIEENVLPWIDLDATVAAYRAALSVNLSLRDAELEEAMHAPDLSSDQAAFRIQRATELDAHLADAARFVAALMLANGERAEALRLLDLSSRLYGPSTPRGLASAEQARQLRDSMESASPPASD